MMEGTDIAGIDVVLSLVEREIRAGVRHGYFDYAIQCEVVNGKKRRITIKAGKNHRFVLAEESQP